MFFVLCSLFFVPRYLRSERRIGDKAAGLCSWVSDKFVKILEMAVVEVALVQGDAELALNLGAGPLGIAKEFDELRVASAIKAFGDVVHNRTGRG